MKSVMAQAATKSQDSSASKRHFHWTQKVGSEDDHEHDDHHDHDHNHVALPTTLFKSSSSSRPSSDQEDRKNNKEREYFHHNTTATTNAEKPQQEHPLGGGGAVSSTRPRKLSQVAVARLRSAVLTAFGRNRHGLPRGGLGPRVVGTLFGSRRGHVHFAFQKDPSLPPALLIELATPINGLVKEMASGLVRIALECDKAKEEKARGGSRLLEERVWRTFCNGKKCGFATRRDCGPRDWKILKAVEPISMGAGVLPPSGFDDHDHHDPRDQGEAEAGDEIMYMRAKFERIVGSRDSEAFYMMNPDSNGAPELSIYLLRV